MSFENQIKEILKARLEGTATEEELAILREWLDRSPQNRELAELLEESAENLPLLGRIYGYDEQRVHTASCLILPTAHADDLLRLQLLYGTDLSFCIGHKGIATGQHAVWVQRCRQRGRMLQLHIFVIHTRFLLRLNGLLHLLQTV